MIRRSWLTMRSATAAGGFSSSRISPRRRPNAPTPPGIRCNLFYADDYAEAVQAVRNGIDTVLTNRALALLNEPASIFRTPRR